MASKSSKKQYFICPFCASTYTSAADLKEHKEECWDNPKNGGDEQGIFDMIERLADDKEKQEIKSLQEEIYNKRQQIALKSVKKVQQQRDQKKELVSQGLGAPVREYKNIRKIVARSISTVYKVVADQMEEGYVPIEGLPPIQTKMGKIYLHFIKSEK